jgi:hypothetical protein
LPLTACFFHVAAFVAMAANSLASLEKKNK